MGGEDSHRVQRGAGLHRGAAADFAHPTRAAAQNLGGREFLMEMTATQDTRALVEQVFRHESGRIIATLIRLAGSFDLAQEAMQDAFAAALATWPQHGV